MDKPIIEKLSPSHDVSNFDCGQPALNRFLHRYALQSQSSNSSQTYVALDEDRVIGYYSLSVGSAAYKEASDRVTKGLARHPVPVMILARLAVDADKQGRGVGRGLLKDCLLRTLQASDIAGIRALLVHAKDEEAKQWYMQFDFDPSPTDPMHLYLLMKDIKKIIRM